MTFGERYLIKYETKMPQIEHILSPKRTSIYSVLLTFTVRLAIGAISYTLLISV